MDHTSPPAILRALLGACLVPGRRAGVWLGRGKACPGGQGQSRRVAEASGRRNTLGSTPEPACVSLNAGHLLRLPPCFESSRAEAGVAVTDVGQGSDLKASVVIFSCPHPVELGKDIDAVARKEHERLVSDLKAAAQGGGYVEKQRSPLSQQALTLWQNGSVPMTVQTIEMVPAEARQKQQPPPPDINHWLSVLIYKDHFCAAQRDHPHAGDEEGPQAGG